MTLQKKLSGNKNNPNEPVRSKEDKILRTQEEQLSRWREHFKEVLNGEPPTEELQVEQNQEELDINVGEITKGEVLRGFKI